MFRDWLVTQIWSMDNVGRAARWVVVSDQQWAEPRSDEEFETLIENLANLHRREFEVWGDPIALIETELRAAWRTYQAGDVMDAAAV